MKKHTIQSAYRLACRLAEKELLKRAMKILKEHSNLDEFICAMGSCFFTTKEGGNTIRPNERAYMAPVANLLSDWDEYLKLSGQGVRFSATGKITYSW